MMRTVGSIWKMGRELTEIGYLWQVPHRIDGSKLAAAHVDEREVSIRYLSDPTNPAAEPRAVRYPEAGSNDALVTLWVFDVESGATVSDALGRHPKVFTDLYVNMVAAGEAGGILDTILMRLATFLEKADALMRKVKGAMIYPAVISAVALICVTVLLWKVIPVFETMFASVNLELPLPTRVVVGLSRFVNTYWWAVFGGAVAAGTI